MLRILPAGIAVGASIWWISGAGIIAVLRECHVAPMALGILLQTGSAMVAGLRWRAVLKGVEATHVPTRWEASVLSLRAQAASVLAPGGIGVDVLRGFEAGYGRGMVGRLTKVAMIERVAGAGVLTLIVLASALPFWRPQSGGILAAVMAIVCVAIVLLLPKSFKVAGLDLNIKPILTFTIANHFLALAALAIGIAGAGVHATAAALLSIAAVAAFTAMLPISFNGYGLRELALAVLAPRLGLDPKALAASGMVASTILLAGVMIVAVAARMIPASRGKQGASDGTSDSEG